MNFYLRLSPRLLFVTCFLWSLVSSENTTGIIPSNHALILSSSRYWFNYRHVINALSIYQFIKAEGIPDENIILMLADEIPSNPRNPLKNAMYAAGSKQESLYNENTEIDFRGDEVTVDNTRRALLGKGSRTLNTDQESNILVYWTGHGGDSFFKFQDVEEITATDIDRLFNEMFRAKKYNEILFIADTCQAFTLGDEITAPNVFMIGSSLRKENSYAHHTDFELGLSVIERYTHKVMMLLKQRGIDGMNLYDGLIGHLDYQQLGAHVGYKDHSCRRKFSEVPMKDFFSNKRAEEASVSATSTTKYAPMTKVVDVPVSRESQPERFPSSPSSPNSASSIATPELHMCSTPVKGHVMDASDPAFVALVAGLITFVILAGYATRS